jgi:hypothetical protein
MTLICIYTSKCSASIFWVLRSIVFHLEVKNLQYFDEILPKSNIFCGFQYTLLSADM